MTENEGSHVPDESDLDVGLAAAFGAPSDVRSSVLGRIERLTGVKTQLALHDPGGDESPLVSVHSLQPDPDAAEDDSRYQLVGEIAKGGVGVIFKGRDRDLGRDVALKVLRRRHMGNPEVFRRFIEESQIGGQLQHPGIVPVYSLGLQPDGRPCFAMKLVKGRTLAARLRERKDPTEGRRSLLRAFERICQTVAYAHARNVIHRDLKPSNVMLGAFGEVLVVDWGFGKVLGRPEPEGEAGEKTLVTTVRSEHEGSASVAGSVMGTPAYMPPEQALGHVDELDEQTDVFALGAILTEILTGQPPYVGESKDLLVMAAQARLEDALQRIDACDADPELKALATRCLSPLRKDRPANAKVVAEEAGAILTRAEDRAHEAELEAVRERTRSAQAIHHAAAERRAKRLAMSLAAAVLVAVVGGGLFHIRRVQDDRARQAAARPAFEEALEEVSRLQGQARWDEALVAATKAQHLAADLDDSAKERADALVADTQRAQVDAETETAQLEKDRVLLAVLEETRLARFDPSSSLAASDEAYADAFRAYGIPLEDFAAEASAAHIRSRDDAFAAHVAAALDDWSALRASLMRPTGSDGDALLARAQACDPDGTQRRLRKLLEEDDAKGLRELTEGVDALSMPPRSLMQLGYALWLRGEREEGIAFLGKAAQAHPDDLWLHYVLGALQHKQRNHDEARTHYTAVLALRPDNVKAHNVLGGLLCDGLKEYEAALRVFDEGVRLAPEDATVHFNRGNALSGLHRLPEALAAYERSLELDPSYARVYSNYGNALAMAGRLDEAIRAAEHGLALDPMNAVGLSALGSHLSKAGRHDEAIRAIEESLRIDPTNAEAHSTLGNVLLKTDRLQQAREHHRRAIELAPDDAMLLSNYAADLCGAGAYEEALEACKRALELECRDPDAYMVHTNRALALFKLHRLDQAIEAYGDAVGLRPDLPDTHADLGAALAAAERSEEALAAFARALEIDPTYSHARTQRAVLLHKLGRVDEALAEYAKVNRADPASFQALANLATVLHEKGELPAALEAAEACVRLKPDYAIGQGTLAGLLLALGRIEEAEVACRKSLAINPNDWYAKATLGSVLLAQGHVEDAVEILREARTLAPESPLVLGALGSALSRKGDLDEAILLHREAIVRAPEKAGHWNNLGEALLKKGLVDEAIEAFRKAIELEPSLTEPHSGLAMAYLARREFEKAVASAREAVRLAPSNHMARHRLGLALLESGHPQAALATFEEAIRLNPAYAGTHTNKGNAHQALGQFEEAVAAHREAIRLDPNFAASYNNLGNSLSSLGSFEEAEAVYREGIGRAPRMPALHANLGILLLRRPGRMDEALRAIREAVRLQPKNAQLRMQLGIVLLQAGHVEDALAQSRAAVALAPHLALTHYNLGNALGAAGRNDEAIEAYAEALRLDPLHAESHCNVAVRYQAVGRFREALEAMRRGHELGSKRADWPYPSAQWLENAERMAPMEDRLPGIFAGTEKLAEPADLALVAGIALQRGLYGASARLLKQVLDSSPAAADDLASSARYNAACCAALAGTGQGKDATSLDDDARSAWREKALAWLKADLVAGKSRTPPRQLVSYCDHCFRDPDLAAVREEEAIAELPAKEQDAWRSYWTDVRAALETAKGGK